MEERVEIPAKESCGEVIEVMDTPERSKNTQIAASMAKFEVNLSPRAKKFAFLLFRVSVVTLIWCS